MSRRIVLPNYFKDLGSDIAASEKIRNRATNVAENRERNC